MFPASAGLLKAAGDTNWLMIKSIKIKPVWRRNLFSFQNKNGFKDFLLEKKP